MRRTQLLITIVVLFLSPLAGGGSSAASATAIWPETAAGPVPGQFIAKMYTEALGRAPTQAEWQAQVDSFRQAPHCPQAVREAIAAIYTGAEFVGLYPTSDDRPVRLLALYRGALNREPNRAGFYDLLAEWSRR